MQLSGKGGDRKAGEEAENRDARRALDLGRLAAPKDNRQGREREESYGHHERRCACGAGETKDQRASGEAGRETGRVKPQDEAALPGRSDRVDPIFANDKQYAEGAAKDRANGKPCPVIVSQGKAQETEARDQEREQKQPLNTNPARQGRNKGGAGKDRKPAGGGGQTDRMRAITLPGKAQREQRHGQRKADADNRH